MRLDTVLRLGRVSNLPTVWTNALAGGALAGVAAGPGGIALAALALSLFYIGGMWLNDAFDAEIDARERASRPIPEGRAGRGTVFAVGGALLAVGVLVGFFANAMAGAIGLALAGTILIYDWSHKRTALGPLLMGGVRALGYLFAASAAGSAGAAAVAAGLGLAAHVVGLTYAARQEAYDRLDRIWPLAILAVPILALFWMGRTDPLAFAFAACLAAAAGRALHLLVRRARGDVPRAVVTLIAGICLYDAAILALAGADTLAFLAAAGFAATLGLQRIAPGT